MEFLKLLYGLYNKYTKVYEWQIRTRTVDHGGITYAHSVSTVQRQWLLGRTSVVMGGTMGTGTFKPEKNLVFFRIKSPGPHRCRPW